MKNLWVTTARPHQGTEPHLVHTKDGTTPRPHQDGTTPRPHQGRNHTSSTPGRNHIVTTYPRQGDGTSAPGAAHPHRGDGARTGVSTSAQGDGTSAPRDRITLKQHIHAKGTARPHRGQHIHTRGTAPAPGTAHPHKGTARQHQRTESR
jgi:hypothetical protein